MLILNYELLLGEKFIDLRLLLTFAYEILIVDAWQKVDFFSTIHNLFFTYTQPFVITTALNFCNFTISFIVSIISDNKSSI